MSEKNILQKVNDVLNQMQSEGKSLDVNTDLSDDQIKENTTKIKVPKSAKNNGEKSASKISPKEGANVINVDTGTDRVKELDPAFKNKKYTTQPKNTDNKGEFGESPNKNNVTN